MEVTHTPIPAMSGSAREVQSLLEAVDLSKRTHGAGIDGVVRMEIDAR